MEIQVKKRNGSLEAFDAEKVNRVLSWATEGLADTSASEVAMRANIYMSEGITTDQIHQCLIDSAVDLLDENNTNYSKVAARLFLYKLRKNVWGSKNPPRLYDVIKQNTELGLYGTYILESYSKQEIDKINEFVNHARDDRFGIGGLIQMSEKYLIQDRKTKKIYETPQFSFIIISMVLFINEKQDRLKLIKKYYDALSKFKINLPTPTLAGARSKTKSFSSCCLIDVLDTKHSLFAANTTTGLVTCDKYGIGLNLGKIRPINSPIKNGETLHSGVIPWLKMFQETIAACQQGGARRGAATVTFPIFHPEIRTVFQLKNNQGTHENRVPHLDYLITISNLFYRRLLKKENISLFSSFDAPDLYELFGTKEFDALYEKYENSDVPRITVPANEIFSDLFIERIETARIYIMNIDQSNDHSPWNEIVNMSNLCVEILQPTIPERYTGDEEAEIGVCTIAATNILNIKNDAEHEEICELLVRSLDNMIDFQDYSIKACERFAKNKRSLGIGLTNVSAWLASQGLNQNSPEAPQAISDIVEKQQYFLMKASCKLAKERGAAPDWNKSSKFADGKTTVLDLYNKNLDEFLVVSKMDWIPLFEEIWKYGLRNLTVSAGMPCESSSVLQESTNGFEPITALVSKKTSTTQTAITIAPGGKKFAKFYLKKKDIKNNDGIIRCCCGAVKWFDMGLSFNVYYDSSNYPNDSVPLSVVINDHLKATKYGAKTFYYLNSKKKKDSTANIEEEQSCSGGACTL